jgi:hypothetical protein
MRCPRSMPNGVLPSISRCVQRKSVHPAIVVDCRQALHGPDRRCRSPFRQRSVGRRNCRCCLQRMQDRPQFSREPRLWTGARWAEHQVHPACRSDSNDTIWSIALAKEQLALVSDNGFHWRLLSFGSHAPYRSRKPAELMPRRALIFPKRAWGALCARQCRKELAILLAEPGDFLQRRFLYSALQPLR